LKTGRLISWASLLGDRLGLFDEFLRHTLVFALPFLDVGVKSHAREKLMGKFGRQTAKRVSRYWETTWRNWPRRESSFKKDTPLGKGEIRVRETTAAEKAALAESQQYLKLLRQHPGKSEAEIVEMMNRNDCEFTNAQR
jgi:hypothetical protein